MITFGRFADLRLKSPMAVLRIYVDEAGQKPLSDEDGPFVVAAVAILGKPPKFQEADGRREWLVERFREFGAIPYYSTIVPYPGYGDSIRGKLAKIDTMARLNRIITGQPENYLGRDGYNPRNMLWTRSVNDVIHVAFARAVAQSRVDRVDVIVDQQTLHGGLGRLLLDQLAGMRARLVNVIEAHRELHPGAARALLSRCQNSSGFLTLKLNNEPNPRGAQCGLKLAHYLASHTFQDLSKPHGESLARLLTGSGFTNFSRDLTGWATIPLSSHAVATWEAMTGLRA